MPPPLSGIGLYASLDVIYTYRKRQNAKSVIRIYDPFLCSLENMIVIEKKESG